MKIARGSNKSVQDWVNYKAAINKSVGMLRSAKREYYHNVFEENQNNPRMIWKSIKSFSGLKNTKRVIHVNSLHVGDAFIN